jgi:hypothetical protein
MRWREGVQSLVLGAAAGGNSARGSCCSNALVPAQAYKTEHKKLFSQRQFRYNKTCSNQGNRQPVSACVPGAWKSWY